MTKIVCFTGAQSTGKTTMRNELVETLRNKGFTVLSDYRGVNISISRDALIDGFVLNENTNFESQYYMAAKYITLDLLTRKHAEINKFDFIILDRSVLDVIPYTQQAESIDDDDTKIIENMLLIHFNLYPIDLMIYCEPISTLVGDGIRSINKKFSEDIAEKFVRIIMDSRIINVYPKNKLKILNNDTVENRMKIVEEEVGKL